MRTHLPLPEGPAYKRVYFDTNAFIRANWPDLSQTMVNALNIARAFGTKTILLNVVEKELGAHWFRECEKRRLAVLDKIKGLQRMLDQLELGDLDVDLRYAWRAGKHI